MSEPRQNRLRRNPAALWSRAPLRVRLVAIAVGLTAIAILLSGFAAHTALHKYLLDRLDQQLVASAPGLARLEQGREQGNPGFDPGHDDGPIGTTPFYVARQSADGDVILALVSPGVSRPDLPKVDSAYAQANNRRIVTVGATKGDGRWRAQVLQANDGSSFTVAYSLSEVEHTVARLDVIELLIGLLMLATVAGLGYVAVSRSLRPLRSVEEAAGAIAAGDLSRRVPEPEPSTEVGRLAVAFNAMVARIESAFADRSQSEAAARASEERMRRFVADASHELRTPLTSIRGFAELYRQGAVSEPEQLRRVMRRVEEEATRMGLLVEDLLLLARLDQERPLERRPVDLLSLAADAVHDAHAIDPDREIALHADDHGAGAPVVIGDEPRLRQVVGNLVTNALTHTPPDTPVELRVSTETEESGQAWAVLSVIDEGPGLGEDEAARVFERFYRADTSRTRTSGGAGLGLSIVAALVAAHGGRVEVDTEPGRGATFRVRLPLASDGQQPVGDDGTGDDEAGDDEAAPEPADVEA